MVCEICGCGESRMVRHHWHDKRGNVHYRRLCRVCNALLVPQLFLMYLVIGCDLPPWETQYRAIRHIRGIEKMTDRQARAILKNGS